MKAGDVYIVNIPEFGGHEQDGLRPAIIITSITKTIATIIPCTANKLALRFPFTYKIQPNKSNGLKNDTIALIFHIRAIDTTFLKKKIGQLDKNTFAKIKNEAIKLIG